MSNENKTKNIEIYDRMSMNDSINKIGKSYRNKDGICGRVVVESFNNKTGEKKIEYDGNNLIVYRGRALSLMRLFNAQLIGSSDLWRNHWKNFNLCLIGIGNGGAASQSPLNPISVRPSIVTLTNQISILDDVTNLNSSDPFYVTSGGLSFKAFSNSDITVLHDEELMVGNSDEYNLLPNDPTADRFQEVVGGGYYRADSMIIAKVSVILSKTEANGGSGNSQTFNEIGMFAADLTQLSSANIFETGYEPVLFAKVNIPSIVKDSSLDYGISWYIML